jgi:excisionase family DNA binding protein
MSTNRKSRRRPARKRATVMAPQPVGIGHNGGPPLVLPPLACVMPPDGRLVLDVPEAGKLLGLSRNGSYEAARQGQLPTIRIGGRVLVPRVALLRLLDSVTPAATTSARAEAVSPAPASAQAVTSS